MASPAAALATLPTHPHPCLPAVAETMVLMECDYVTPSFFRELEKEYQSGLHSEGGGLEGAGDADDRMAQLARGAWLLWGRREAAGGCGCWGQPRQEGTSGLLQVHEHDHKLSLLLPAAAGMPQHSGDTGDSDDDSEAPESAPPTARSAISRETSPQPKLPQLRDDLKAGWLEKRSGDSSNLNALPVDSWKWQRRW